MKFEGSLTQLKALSKNVGLFGHWMDEGDFKVFSCDQGGFVNWWPSTGLIMFTGPPTKRSRLEDRFKDALGGENGVPQLQHVIDIWPRLTDSTKCKIESLAEHDIEVECSEANAIH